MDHNKYVPLIIKSDDADPIKYYSTSAAARHCGVTKQTLDYAHRNRCTRIVRRKGGVKEFRLTCQLAIDLPIQWIREFLVRLT